MPNAYNINDLRATLVELVEKAKADVIANHEKAGQVASGRTRASLRVEDESGSDGIGVSLWGRRFFQGLETGRRGGRVPQGFYYIIRQWAMDKGLHFDSTRERNSFAYLTARKIAREGTQLYRQGGRNDIYSDVFTRLIGEVESELDKFFDGFMDTMFDESMDSIKIN